MNYSADTTSGNYNIQYNSIPPTRDSIVERLLQEGRISLQEAVILLKEKEIHYQQTGVWPWTFTNPYPVTYTVGGTNLPSCSCKTEFGGSGVCNCYKSK